MYASILHSLESNANLYNARKIIHNYDSKNPVTHLESTKERTSLAVTASSNVTSQQNMPWVMRTEIFVKRKRKEKSTQPLTLGISTTHGCNVPRESKYRREPVKLK